MRQQVGGAAVNGLLCDDVLTRLGKCLNGVSDRSRAGGKSQTGYAALKSSSARPKRSAACWALWNTYDVVA